MIWPSIALPSSRAQPRPPAPDGQLPVTQYYYTLEGMRRAELDFMRLTLDSPPGSAVFMCGDMPMDDMAQDRAFPGQFMLALVRLLQQGLQLNNVHYLGRPLGELMLGLEGWLPLYMTGQVAPYYLPGVHNRVYGHLHYCSDTAALAGECIAGHHAQGRYYLTRDPQDLAYYRQKTDLILQKALPLMEVYRLGRAADFGLFYAARYHGSGGRSALLCTPPLHTLSPGLLQDILRRCGVEQAEAARLTGFAAQERQQLEQFLDGGGTRTDELTVLTREEFDASPPVLPFAAAFPQVSLPYTWEEYTAHVALSRDYAAQRAGYRLLETKGSRLRSIDLLLYPGHWVLVSKQRNPTIHFAIYHPTLRAAFERLTLPVQESTQEETP